jgi:hypothetical protein
MIMKMKKMVKIIVRIGFLTMFVAGLNLSVNAQKYSDGRPATGLRMDAKDYGIVLKYGDGPGNCDMLGARDVWVFEDKGTYYMHYDAAGTLGNESREPNSYTPWI